LQVIIIHIISYGGDEVRVKSNKKVPAPFEAAALTSVRPTINGGVRRAYAYANASAAAL
jgi:hypothetical protein